MAGVMKHTINLDHIRQITHSDFVGMAEEIGVFDDVQVKWTHITGNMNNRYERISVGPGKGIAGVIYKTGKPWIVENVSSEIPLPERHQYPILINEKIDSFIAVPIMKNGMAEGVILIGYRTPDRVSRSLTMTYIKNIQKACKCELGGVHL